MFLSNIYNRSDVSSFFTGFTGSTLFGIKIYSSTSLIGIFESNVMENSTRKSLCDTIGLHRYGGAGYHAR